MQQFWVEIYSDSKRDEWDQFVTQSNCDTFLFLRGFMDYHKEKFNDFSLMIYKNSSLLAMLPANKNHDEINSHEGLTYGGLIYKTNLKTSDTIHIWKSILEFLNANGFRCLRLKDLPFIYLKSKVNNPLDYLVFKLKARRFRVDMHSVINLGNYKLSSSRLEGIKRGEKSGLVVRESQSFNEFWDEILVPNLESKHSVSPVHSIAEINLLKSRFKTDIRQFNAYHNEAIVAGATIFEMKNCAHCQYISGNESKNLLGSLDFLHVYLIKEVFYNKKYFSFGTSNINSGQNVNSGLQFWKEGFGARSITQSFYEISTKNYELLDEVMV